MHQVRTAADVAGSALLEVEHACLCVFETSRLGPVCMILLLSLYPCLAQQLIGCMRGGLLTVMLGRGLAALHHVLLRVATVNCG